MNCGCLFGGGGGGGGGGGTGDRILYRVSK